MAYGGQALSSFADAFLRMGQETRANEASARINELRDLQIQQAQREAAEQTMLPQALADLANVTGQETTLVPGREATPAVAATPAQPGVGEGPPSAEGAPESDLPYQPGTPGTQAVTGHPPVKETFHTYQSLASALGPDKMAVLLKYPQGQRALAELGVTTEPEIRRRQKIGQASAEMRDLYDEAGRLVDKSDLTPQDLQQSLLKRAAALERYADATDSESVKLQAMDKAERLREKAQDVVGDPLAVQDMTKLRDSMKAVISSSGDPDSMLGLLDTLSTMKSKFGMAEAQAMMSQVIKGLDLKNADRDVLAFSKAVAKIMAGDSSTGKQTNLDSAVTQAMRENPDLGSRMISKMLTTNRGLSMLDGLLGGAGGLDLKGDNWRAAMYTLRRQGVAPSDPTYMDKLAALAKTYAERPSEDRIASQTYVQNLYAGLRLAESELNRAHANIRRDQQAGKDADPEDVKTAQQAQSDIQFFKGQLEKVPKNQEQPLRPSGVESKATGEKAYWDTVGQQTKVQAVREIAKKYGLKRGPDGKYPMTPEQQQEVLGLYQERMNRAWQAKHPGGPGVPVPAEAAPSQ